MIPVEAVEAAARKLGGARYGIWELVPEAERRLYLRDAKLALEAAAPYLIDALLKAGWQEPERPYVV
jgi:hypothetical protein